MKHLFQHKSGTLPTILMILSTLLKTLVSSFFVSISISPSLIHCIPDHSLRNNELLRARKMMVPLIIDHHSTVQPNQRQGCQQNSMVSIPSSRRETLWLYISNTSYSVHRNVNRVQTYPDIAKDIYCRSIETQLNRYSSPYRSSYPRC